MVAPMTANATLPIRSIAPPPPIASATGEMRVRPAIHWPNNQLASEAMTVSSVRMTTAVTMTNRDPRLGAACAPARLPSIPLRAEKSNAHRAKKGFFNGAPVLHNSRQ